MPKPYIAVRRGRRPGIYAGWRYAEPQVRRFRGQLFEGFNSFEEAHRFVFDEPPPARRPFADLHLSDGRVVRVGLPAEIEQD